MMLGYASGISNFGTNCDRYFIVRTCMGNFPCLFQDHKTLYFGFSRNWFIKDALVDVDDRWLVLRGWRDRRMDLLIPSASKI